MRELEGASSVQWRIAVSGVLVERFGELRARAAVPYVLRVLLDRAVRRELAARSHVQQRLLRPPHRVLLIEFRSTCGFTAHTKVKT